MRQPIHERARLSGAGTCDDEQWAIAVRCGCGLLRIQLGRELGLEDISMQDVRDRVTAKFAEAFDLTAVVTSRGALLETVA